MVIYGSKNKMNEKQPEIYLIHILYLLFGAGIGTGICVTNNIGGVLWLIGISIVLISLSIAFVVAFNIKKEGYKLVFVKRV